MNHCSDSNQYGHNQSDHYTHHYKGRFAPSATGALHLGSLVTSLACALEAHSKTGSWFVRIDDIDHHRCSKESSLSIQHTIQEFFSAYPPVYIYSQSENQALYRNALEALIQKSLVYRCSCSRKDIASWQTNTIHRCRDNIVLTIDNLGPSQHTYRFKSNTPKKSGAKQDPQSQILEDLVLYRKEGYYSYHLSCITNDHTDGVTHIIRGADLIDAEQPQRKLITALDFTQPNYSYIPLVRSPQGQKLSKQNHAPAINTQDMSTTLIHALTNFNWTKPLAVDTQSTFDSLWDWALHHWDLSLNLWSNN